MSSFFTLTIPYWTVLLVSAFILLARVAMPMRRRCEAGHYCAFLRATPDRCPECGSVPSPASA